MHIVNRIDDYTRIGFVVIPTYIDMIADVLQGLLISLWPMSQKKGSPTYRRLPLSHWLTVFIIFRICGKRVL